MEQYERNFCDAVYPEHTDAAIAINNEKTMIMDATDKILSLQSRIQELEGYLSRYVPQSVTDDFDWDEYFSRNENTPTDKAGE